MNVIASLVRHAVRRLRRGPRGALPPYVLLLPEKHSAALGAPLQAVIDLHAQGWPHGAAARLRAMVRRAPQDAALHALLGQVLLGLGDERAAALALGRARELDSRLAQALVESAQKTKARGLRREALGGLLLAALLDPGSWWIKSAVADVYYAMGKLEQAVTWVDAAYRQSGRNSLRVKRLILQFAPIYRSVEHLEEVRRLYLEGLHELEQADFRIDNVLAEVNLTNFYLPYQGMNERDTQARLAALLLRVAPELGFVARHCAVAPPPWGECLKLGVVSGFFGLRHSVGIAYNRLIRELADRPDFELTAVCFSETAAAAMQATVGPRGQAVALPKSDLAAARKRLAELEFDVLLYADVGMEPSTYYLAFGRYAPLQGVLGGHPLTTGIPNMDIYVSYETIESADAQDHYTERLVRLKHHAMGMEPLPRLAPRGRDELGLPSSGNLYVCPLKLQKFHPDFDTALAGILNADARAEIVLFEDSNYDAWDTQVRERLTRVLGSRIERVSFLPWQKPNDFLSILRACDVALDTFHFGAGTTAAMTLGIGRPMVTLPSAFQRGRATLANYIALGITDCIASDADDYVRIAVRLGTDPQYRAALSERLLARAPLLFESHSAGAELAERLHALYRERVQGSPLALATTKIDPHRSGYSRPSE